MASVVKVAFDRWIFPALDHGRSGTIAIFAIVPGEGQDASQAWPGPTTARHQWRPDQMTNQPDY